LVFFEGERTAFEVIIGMGGIATVSIMGSASSISTEEVGEAEAEAGPLEEIDR